VERSFHIIELLLGRATVATQTGTQAVDRASTLLVAVLQADRPVPFADLAAAAALPKSTASRILTSLERHGLVRRGPDASVRPGPVLARYAGSGRADALLRLAQPHLDRIGELTGETVNLAVPGPTAVEQIAQVDSRYMLGAVNWVGRDVPFHCSALGKVFLAHRTVSIPKGRLERRTDRTITSRDHLASELATVRRLGYAVADSELEPGLVAVAAPITDADGAVVAAVSVTGPSVRLTGDRIPGVGRLLVAEARAVSAALDPNERPRTRRVGVA
jgi:IclR family acetate operon transcriptional repressor